MVDNSQGHSAYPPDTLHVSQMNLNPGGAKPKMWDGWFIHNRQRVSQLMVFPKNHLKHPGESKGMKQILSERGLWQNGLLLICENKKNQDPELDGKCDPEATNCCATWILSLQPDFQEQKSLVQETIEAAGHLCIFPWNFTVSWTSLSSSGEQWRSICGSIVIILMTGWG